MALAAGTKLGPYEILKPLGAGGMGEVYRARDARLDRIVAVKVLPESFASDSVRLQRFEQEARALGALSHPNLVGIFDIGSQSGVHYLVSEFLEGQTLRERMNSGPLAARKIPEHALQIANGLAAAHDKGIVHRDLKPENIFITCEERVKILDFGLAKQTHALAGFTGETDTATTPAATTPGTVMGTAGYMSPEQVRGATVDHRSDIFSFGAILYEMVSGKQAFKAESGIETMNAILKEEPPEIDPAHTKVSPGLDRIARHCLEKNPADRFQSGHDLAFAIGALSDSGSTAAIPAVAPPRKGTRLVWAAMGVAALALAALGYFLVRGTRRAERLEFTIPVSGEASHMALSPDGRMLAYVAPDDASGANMVSVQRIGAPAASVLPGTEGASFPFWSPDDATIGFFADGKLKKVAVSGGTPQILAVAPAARGGSWSGNTIIFAPASSGPLWKVSADGRDAAPVTEKTFVGTGDSSHRWPVFLPDGDHFVFWAGNFTNLFDDRSGGIYLSSLAANTKKSRLVLTHSNPGYSNGHLFYLDSQKELVAIPLDISRGTVTNEPQVVATGVGFQPSIYRGTFTVAENGTVVYSTSNVGVLSLLTWFDRAGKELGRVGEPAEMANPTFSPDGNSLTVDITDVKENNVDVWVEDLRRGTASRFTFDPAEEVAGIWSRDGRMIAFRRSGSGSFVLLKDARGLEPERKLMAVDPGFDEIPTAWSSDDKEILCTSLRGGGGTEIDRVSASDGKRVPFLTSAASESTGQISPDGKWVAYASNESGDWEIYVTTYPGAVGKWQVSRGGGTEPRWRSDGKEIFYIGAHSTLTAVSVATEQAFSAGTPTPLFHFYGRAPISSTDLFMYDVAKDGKRFLVNRYVKPDHISPLFVVINSTAEWEK